MLQRVAVPVAVTAKFHIAVDGIAAEEHQGTSGLIVAGVLQGHGPKFNGRLQTGFAQVVRKFVIRVCAEIVLTHVGYDIRCAGSGLKARGCKGQHRVQDGKPGTDDDFVVVVLPAAFELFILLGDDCGLGGLAAGGGKGRHHAQRQSRFGDGLQVKEVPHIAIVGYAKRNSLGTVDGGATADGKEKINLLPAAQLDALIHSGDAGVGHHTAKVGAVDAGVLQDAADFTHQGLDKGLADVVQQNPRAAMLPDKFCNPPHASFSVNCISSTA